MTRQLNRRKFLQSTAAVGAGHWVASRTAAAQGKSASDTLNFACIGVGGKGRRDSNNVGEIGNIVALCDIDDTSLARKGEQFPKAKRFNDFRKMLDEMGNSIDAVTVSTPDHTHTVASVMAMRMGKHVYCQKPLTHTVAEARLMRETARKYNVITQMGNQGTSVSGFRRGIEIVQSKAIGEVHEAHVWTNRPFRYWAQAPDIVSRPRERPNVPPHVHWDLFLGPAAERPYHPFYHPHDWRGWWDFGTGALGDMACHTANLVFKALKLGLPTRVSARSGELNPETCPAWATITYEFPQRGNLPACKLTWYEGAREGKRNLPSPDLLQGEEASASGLVLIGDKGVMFSPNDYGAEQVLLPTREFTDYEPPTPTLPRWDDERSPDQNQKQEWVEAILGGPAPMSNFEYSSVLTEAMLLGNVAVRVGHPIEYDAAAGEVTNCKEAEQYIRTPYRDGWKL